MFEVDVTALRAAARALGAQADSSAAQLSTMMSTSDSLLSTITEARVSAAVTLATAAIAERMDLVARALTYCDGELKATAATYELSDDTVRDRMIGLGRATD